MELNKDETTLIEELLLERDELYLELSKLREIDNGALEKAESIIRKKDDKIKQLTDQLVHCYVSSHL